MPILQITSFGILAKLLSISVGRRGSLSKIRIIEKDTEEVRGTRTGFPVKETKENKNAL